MKKFVYFLADSPSYPNEIYANSAAEVKRLVMESIPDESQILRIIEVTPKNQGRLQTPSLQASPQMKQQPQIMDEELDPNDFSDANDFFNNVMNEAIKKGNAEQKNEEMVQEEKPEVEATLPPQEPPLPSVQQTVKIEPPRFFEEAGIQFKFDNGKLFKRSWIDVSDEETPLFRIKSKKTGKLADTEKFAIEKLEWVEIKS